MSNLRFHYADYIVFGATLMISAGIGVYHAVASKQSTTTEYLLANRKMLSLPVAMSLLASFMSGITILGVPSEIYTYGIQYGLLVVSEILYFPAVALIFVPTLYELGLTSSYEYLERRFSFGVRIIATITFIFYTLFYMAIVIYGPSLALQSVTGLPVWVSILSIGVICTFYTTIGGIKAVIWNDVFQGLVMFCGLVTIVIVGTVKVGGPSNVVSILKERDRTDVNFSFDPRERTTFWALFLGSAFAVLPLWSVNQTAVQRYLASKSLKEAQNSVWMAWPINFLGVSLCVICGAVIFAFYDGCDPKTSGAITSNDQILPYFALDLLGNLHGLPGVFLASLFSGTLSTLSSGLNSLAAIFLEDFLKPFANRREFNISETKLTQLSKYTAALFGFITIGLSFLAGSLGSIIQSFYSISGVTGAPIVAVFSMGMFTKFANKWGAYVGVACGIGFGLFVAIGSTVLKPPRFVPAVSINECSGNITLNKTSPAKGYDGLEIFKLSPFWYSFYCFFVTFIIGLLVSYLLKNDQHVDERLLVKWKRLLPGKGSVDIEGGAQNEKTGLHKQDLNSNDNIKKTEGEASNEDSTVLVNTLPLEHEQMSTRL